MITAEKLDFWIQNQFNVLIEGHAGVGKSAMVIQALKRNKLRWKYFSAATMDPWVDFIGVPKERLDEETGNSYLDLVRPKDFAQDDVEAIFLDELNRAPKKVRNAVMELIQFKSINGKKYKNLKVIIAAINPDEEEGDKSDYDVEPLDPAQKDRFHIHVTMPYKPVLKYFVCKYGERSAKVAVSWWNGLPKEMQMIVSPRRLDYALRVKEAGGDIRDVLPAKSNVSKLSQLLRNGPVEDTLDAFKSTNNLEEAKEWLAVENNYAAAEEVIVRNKAYRMFFLPLMPHEKISKLVEQETKVLTTACELAATEETIATVLSSIVEAEQNSKISSKIKSKLQGKSSESVLSKGKVIDYNDKRVMMQRLSRKENDRNTTQQRGEFAQDVGRLAHKIVLAQDEQSLGELKQLSQMLNNAVIVRTHARTLRSMGNGDTYGICSGIKEFIDAVCVYYNGNASLTKTLTTKSWPKMPAGVVDLYDNLIDKKAKTILKRKSKQKVSP